MEQQKIVVEIGMKEMDAIILSGKTKQQLDSWINEKLRNAGIPMVGAFEFRGVSRGQMNVEPDPVAEKVTFTWRSGRADTEDDQR